MGNLPASQKGATAAEERLAYMKNRGSEKVASTKNALLIKEQWIDAFNCRDLKGVRNLCADDFVCYYKGADNGIPVEMFLDTLLKLLASFPDVCCSFDEIQEVMDGVVRVTNFRSRGTHTGKPFGFGPYPEVPTSQIVVESEPNHLTIEIVNGKMTRYEIDPKGAQLVGSPLFYVRVGGKLNLSR